MDLGPFNVPIALNPGKKWKEKTKNLSEEEKTRALEWPTMSFDDLAPESAGKPHQASTNGDNSEDKKSIDNRTSNKTDVNPDEIPDEADDAPEDDVVPGEKCKVKTLYEGPPRCTCCINWVEDYPDDLREDLEESAEGRANALTLRKSKKHGGDEGSLELHSIVIRSAHMKAMLRRVFRDYSGVTPDLRKVTFEKPFAPFFHRWREFGEAVGDLPSDEQRAAHWRLLYDTVHAELAGVITQSRDLIDHGVITMELAWTLFKPGDVVYTSGALGVQALSVVSSGYRKDSSGGKYYEVTGKYMDYDGAQFGFVEDDRTIGSFRGTKKITDLDVYPISFHDKSNELVAELTARGRIFEQHAGIHVKDYNNTATEEVQTLFSTKEVVIAVNDRIVIDAHAFQEAASDRPDPLSARDKEPLADDKLTDDELLLCCKSFKGFALRNKRWIRLRVDAIAEVIWNPSAFDDLVLTPARKEMILALLEGQLQSRDTFRDLIPGKGQSVIALLSGSPGTGKTLTAESVAETVKAPLYSATAGDLGVQAGDVERRLGSIFENAARWNAVLLLDEADIFLEKRTTSDLERNKLVTIFLRMLEYYQGVLFLTTNRAESFDPAFLSRIHMHIEYPDLDCRARLAIWRNFLQPSAGGSTLTAPDMEDLAAKELNGRNFRNVVKMARLLAKRAAKPLSLDHLLTAIDVSSRF